MTIQLQELKASIFFYYPWIQHGDLKKKTFSDFISFYKFTAKERLLQSRFALNEGVDDVDVVVEVLVFVELPEQLDLLITEVQWCLVLLKLKNNQTFLTILTNIKFEH